MSAPNELSTALPRLSSGSDREDGWVLDEASTQDLVDAMAECDRGEVVTAEEVFAALSRNLPTPKSGD